MNDYLNKEGYPDPTPYHAIFKENAHGFRPVVCVVASSSGLPKKDALLLEAYCRVASEKGTIPVAPALTFAYLDDDELYEYSSLILLTKSRELWVYGGTKDAGVRSLVKAAKKRGLPIRYFDEP